MGRFGLPLYGEDIGSAVETAEDLIAKIKTNKFDTKELAELVDALNVIKAAIEKDEA